MKQTAPKYGTILKREALSNASSYEDPRILILEAKDPFPGFYCSEQMPADISCKEKSYYLPVSTLPCCHQDMVCRISLEVNRKFGIHACPAHISLQGKYSKAIRVKNMQGHGMDEVVGIFEQNGISFHRHKKISTYLSHIYLKSFFEILAVEENIFRNALSPDIFYLTIPQNLDWKPFEQIITFQKSKNTFKNFEAAIDYWMEKPHFIDFLRIYGKKLSMHQLNEIREKFIEILQYYNEKKVLI
ncbi:MAG: hypothetical protein K9H16_13505 [Bacteroidales bacterium]|nr:hypothetical protein [Bacteroidales bacterium]